MLAKRITSLQHPKVAHWQSIRLSKEARLREKSVLVAGKKVIRELSPSIVLASIGTEEHNLVAGREQYLVTPEILRKITGLQEPDGLAAEVMMPVPSEIGQMQRILILDGLQDPGNVGTLLRTAWGLGWEGVVTVGSTVDLFNDKVLRAARGVSFTMPYRTEPTVGSWIERFEVWVADSEGSPLKSTIPKTPVALVLGSEGRGPGSWTHAYTHRVSIPLCNGVTSFGVASAGAILLYGLRQ
ncbi:MAG: hypothetical protein RL235_641 [Chlamydiota bacterium]